MSEERTNGDNLHCLVQHLLGEIAIVEKRRDGLRSFLRVNAQYWDDRQSDLNFYNAQIERLKSYLPNKEVSVDR
jgi:hypothetical protein